MQRIYEHPARVSAVVSAEALAVIRAKAVAQRCSVSAIAREMIEREVAMMIEGGEVVDAEVVGAEETEADEGTEGRGAPRADLVR